MKRLMGLLCLLLTAALGAGKLEAGRLVPINPGEWVRSHLDVRKAELARDMSEVSWSWGLASVAEEWAKGCRFRHSPTAFRRQRAGFGYVGENLYIKTGAAPNASLVVEESWVSAERELVNDDFTCSKGTVCGHYTQAVWAKTCALGCAVALCPRLELKGGEVWESAHYAVCHYGPGGNYPGVAPFRKGHRCGECRGRCSDEGLCRAVCPAASGPSWEARAAELKRQAQHRRCRHADRPASQCQGLGGVPGFWLAVKDGRGCVLRWTCRLCAPAPPRPRDGLVCLWDTQTDRHGCVVNYACRRPQPLSQRPRALDVLTRPAVKEPCPPPPRPPPRSAVCLWEAEDDRRGCPVNFRCVSRSRAGRPRRRLRKSRLPFSSNHFASFPRPSFFG